MIDSIEKAILYFCNQKLVNPVFDFVFVGISDTKTFIIPLILILAVAYWKGSHRVRLAIVLGVVCVALADPSTHYILKKSFARLRPCWTYDDLRLLVGCGGRYGFPSNHAANSFAVVGVLSFFFRKYVLMFYSLGFFVALSRVYLGKHYASDVIVGAVHGQLIALAVIFMVKQWARKVPETSRWRPYADTVPGAKSR